MKQKYKLFIVLSWLSIQIVKAQEVVIGDNVSINETFSVGAYSSVAEDMTIGGSASDSGYDVPYYSIDKYSLVQMLYSPGEIGKSGTVKSIAFNVLAASSFATSDLKVYLGHKKSTFSGTTDYVRSSDLTLVYSGSPTLGLSTGWETLTCNQNSFNYNGTDYLVVVVARKSSTYNLKLKYGYSTKSGYTLYRGDDVNSYYANVTSTSYSYSTSSSRPSIKININGPASGWYVPFYNFDKYSTVQALYTPAEIQKVGKITGISFNVMKAASFATSELKIYLGHKSGKFSGTGDYVRSSDLTLVYSGSPTLGQSTGWEELKFNQGSFNYNGTDNLVVVVTKKCSSITSLLKYRYFEGSGYTLIRGDDNNSSYGDVSNTSNAYRTTNSRPSVQFNIDGLGSTTSVPYYNLFKNATVQTLYTPVEIGKSGKINSISFMVAKANSFATSELKVYLGHKSGKFSGTGDFVRSSNLTLVYSGSPTLGQSTGWETLTFNRGSFEYNGKDNLVVVVTRKSSTYTGTLQYRYFNDSGFTLVRYNDENTSYGDITNTTNAYLTTTSRPTIKIGVQSLVPITVDTDYIANGVTYTLHANGSATVKALTLSWREVDIPTTVRYNDYSFNVTEIGASAFSAFTSYSVTLPSTITSVNASAFANCRALSVVWNSSVALTTSHVNSMKVLSPNVLIYVNSTSQLYSSSLQDIANLVVNTTARKVELKDGYNFYCPKQFTANTISYKRNFKMVSAVDGKSAGWETIALPFTVSSIKHATKGDLVPFYNFTSTSTEKPFWLYSWGSSGWKRAGSISYNTPYLICMPNNEKYYADYNLSGEITFSSTNATVYKSSTSRSGYSSSTYNSKQFYPSHVALTKDNYIYNINAGSTSSETGNETPGSAFIKNLRDVKPFEGYIYSTTSNARMFEISLFDDDETTGIIEIRNDRDFDNETVIYDMRGRLVFKNRTDNVEQILGQLPKGIYIVNGKKMIVGE